MNHRTSANCSNPFLKTAMEFNSSMSVSSHASLMADCYRKPPPMTTYLKGSLFIQFIEATQQTLDFLKLKEMKIYTTVELWFFCSWLGLFFICITTPYLRSDLSCRRLQCDLRRLEASFFGKMLIIFYVLNIFIIISLSLSCAVLKHVSCIGFQFFILLVVSYFHNHHQTNPRVLYSIISASFWHLVLETDEFVRST